MRKRRTEASVMITMMNFGTVAAPVAHAPDVAVVVGAAADAGADCSVAVGGSIFLFLYKAVAAVLPL
jgi:hypothetical protein